MTDKKTIVEEGTRFEGSLTSTCPVVVNGQIQGDVETPSLSVSATGTVKGKVKVGEVSSEGEIEGEFDADTIRLSGRVRDNTVLRANTLEVKLSSDEKMQCVFGQSELQVGDEPTDGEGGGRKKRGRKGRGEDAADEGGGEGETGEGSA